MGLLISHLFGRRQRFSSPKAAGIPRKPPVTPLLQSDRIPNEVAPNPHEKAAMGPSAQVAQLVEHIHGKEGVTSSSLVLGLVAAFSVLIPFHFRCRAV
jgi:hypothetical protein